MKKDVGKGFYFQSKIIMSEKIEDGKITGIIHVQDLKGDCYHEEVAYFVAFYISRMRSKLISIHGFMICDQNDTVCSCFSSTCLVVFND